MNIADYKGVWVFAEQREGELQKVSLELLGEGRRQADKLGVKLTALLLGDNVAHLADELAKHGADEVLVAEDKNLATRKERYIREGKEVFNGTIYVPDDLDIIKL